MKVTKVEAGTLTVPDKAQRDQLRAEALTKDRTRQRMIVWYTRMAHTAEFNETLPNGFVSYGDLRHKRGKPTLRKYLLNTLSIYALRTASMIGYNMTGGTDGARN